MQNLELTDEEVAALTQELHDIVETDGYPFWRPTLDAVPVGTGQRVSFAPAIVALGWGGLRWRAVQIKPPRWDTARSR